MVCAPLPAAATSAPLAPTTAGLASASAAVACSAASACADAVSCSRPGPSRPKSRGLPAALPGSCRPSSSEASGSGRQRALSLLRLLATLVAEQMLSILCSNRCMWRSDAVRESKRLLRPPVAADAVDVARLSAPCGGACGGAWPRDANGWWMLACAVMLVGWNVVARLAANREAPGPEGVVRCEDAAEEDGPAPSPGLCTGLEPLHRWLLLFGMWFIPVKPSRLLRKVRASPSAPVACGRRKDGGLLKGQGPGDCAGLGRPAAGAGRRWSWPRRELGTKRGGLWPSSYAGTVPLLGSLLGTLKLDTERSKPASRAAANSGSRRG